MPFPNISSALAISAHMYVCLEDGQDKHLAKCQTYKPHHLLNNKEPFNYIIENADVTRNPFQRKSIIDCDKKFGISGVTIPTKMRTTVRPDICEPLFTEVVELMNEKNSPIHILPTDGILSLNSDISAR